MRTGDYPIRRHLRTGTIQVARYSQMARGSYWRDAAWFAASLLRSPRSPRAPSPQHDSTLFVRGCSLPEKTAVFYSVTKSSSGA